MAQAQTSHDADHSVQSFMDDHHFLLRRLHSLSGIVPVGLFVIFHLFTNAQLAAHLFTDKSTFQHEVDFIHSLPALVVLEVVLWLSIAFHAILGVYYATTGRSNTRSYPYMDNKRYYLQRATGYIALIFIFLHVATLRWQWNFFGWYTPFFANGSTSGTPLADATTAKALQSHWLVVVLYLVGGLAVVFHWANGLWTAAISWGLTVTVRAQRRWGYVCATMGILLTIALLGAIGGALAYEVSPENERAFQEMIEARSGNAASPVGGH